MLHCGKFYLDFYNINLQNFTLVTAGELIVNGGRIWARKKRILVHCSLEQSWSTWNSMESGLQNDPSTFEHIVHLVRPFIAKTDAWFRKVIPVEQRAAITLWRLAIGNSYHFTEKNCCCKINRYWNEIRNELCKCTGERGSDLWHFRKLRGNSRGY